MTGEDALQAGAPATQDLVSDQGIWPPIEAVGLDPAAVNLCCYDQEIESQGAMSMPWSFLHLDLGH